MKNLCILIMFIFTHSLFAQDLDVYGEIEGIQEAVRNSTCSNSIRLETEREGLVIKLKIENITININRFSQKIVGKNKVEYRSVSHVRVPNILTHKKFINRIIIYYKNGEPVRLKIKERTIGWIAYIPLFEMRKKSCDTSPFDHPSINPDRVSSELEDLKNIDLIPMIENQ